jgi:hypothetical protein
VIDGQGVERRPTVVKAPLRDFTQKSTHRWFEMWQAGLLAQISVCDETRIDARARLAPKAADLLMVIKQRLGKLLRFGAHRMSFSFNNSESKELITR